MEGGICSPDFLLWLLVSAGDTTPRCSAFSDPKVQSPCTALLWFNRLHENLSHHRHVQSGNDGTHFHCDFDPTLPPCAREIRINRANPSWTGIV